MDAKWDPNAKVTSSGELAHLAVYLKITGFFDSLCSDFPVEYTSNNACSNRDIVGSMEPPTAN